MVKLTLERLREARYLMWQDKVIISVPNLPYKGEARVKIYNLKNPKRFPVSDYLYDPYSPTEEELVLIRTEGCPEVVDNYIKLIHHVNKGEAYIHNEDFDFVVVIKEGDSERLGNLSEAT